VPEDVVRLSLFSFSLSGEAKRWFHSFKGNSLKTWDEVVEKFLKKYFRESKTVEGKAAISSFHQFLDESLSEALERFRGLLRKMPTHGFSEPIQLNILIDELKPQSKYLLDAFVEGKIKLKTLEETLSKLPTQLHFGQPSPSSILQVVGCVICGGAHDSGCCVPTKDATHKVNYIGNQPRPNFNAGFYSGFQHGQKYN